MAYKINVDFSALNSEMKKLNEQSVVVGVLDTTTKAAKADYSKPVTTLSNGVESVKRRFVKTKGRSKNITLKKLLLILDKKRGLISSVLVNPNNKQLVEMVKLFAKLNKTPKDIRRLENIGRALVRNPILRGDYNPNAKSVIDRKKFNHYGLQTATLFKNIKAVYRRHD